MKSMDCINPAEAKILDVEPASSVGRRRAMHGFPTLTALVLSGMVAGTDAPAQDWTCLPPERPMADLPEDILIEYRRELVDEFESYFRAIGDHIACLDKERARALLEAREVTEGYAAFLKIPARKETTP